LHRRSRGDAWLRGADACKLLAAGLVLVDELLGEAAVLDLVEKLLHGELGVGGDDARAGDVVSPLGGVGDGVAHVFESAAIDEIDDELELVAALEVGKLGLVASLAERLEASLDEGGDAAAEDSLLAEEVGFGLFGEGGLEDSGAGGADALGVAEGEGERGAAGILLHGYERRRAAAFGEDLADAMAGSLGRDHRDIDGGRRGDGAEADVEAVGEHEGDVGLHVGRDLGVVDLGGGLVGSEVHDDVGPLADVGHGIDDEAGGARAGGAGRVGAKADADINARVLEVERVGVALRAVADDGDFFGLDEREVCVCVVIRLCHGV
jgi:hypothetical protein